jgi:hypothetical protein
MRAAIMHLLLAGLCADLVGGGSVCAAMLQPLLVISSAQLEYDTGAPPQILVELVMPASAAQEAQVVQTFADTAISVVKLTKDGVEVEPEDGMASYIDGLQNAQLSGLEDLLAGERKRLSPVVLAGGDGDAILVTAHFALMPWRYSTIEQPNTPDNPNNLRLHELATVPTDPASPRLQELGSIDLSGSQQQVLVRKYPLTHPGKYVMQLAYRYLGTQGGKASVFSEEIISNELAFTLR